MHKSTLLWLQSISIAAHDIYPLGVRLPVFDVLWLGLRPECQQGTTLHIYHSKPIQIASAGILTLWTQASSSELLRAPRTIIAQQSTVLLPGKDAAKSFPSYGHKKLFHSNPRRSVRIEGVYPDIEPRPCCYFVRCRDDDLRTISDPSSYLRYPKPLPAQDKKVHS